MDRNSIDIDPFKYPSEEDIKESWTQWAARDGKPCQTEAIKWLKCTSVVKDFYKMYGKDVNNDMEWHKFMLKKCYKPYTAFHECKIDEREKKLQQMREEFGEEKFKKSEAQVKAMLAKKLGKDQAEKVWEYNKDYNSRFKELRKAVDEEMGVVRNGQEVPDFESQLEKAPAKSKETKQKDQQAHVAESSSESSFKGWWSEPESRLKKKKQEES